MAVFSVAFERLMQNEGFPGYVNNPYDRGGETVAGISRKNWPGSPVWSVVDAAKQKPGFPGNLKASAELMHEVYAFYQRNFWPRYFSEITSQEVATWIFDKYVNTGSLRMVVRWVQEAAGVSADGFIGPLTLRALNQGDTAAILERAKEQARRFYTTLAEKDPTQKRFLAGWLARV